jgi:hypothetical protein
LPIGQRPIARFIAECERLPLPRSLFTLIPGSKLNRIWEPPSRSSPRIMFESQRERRVPSLIEMESGHRKKHPKGILTVLGRDFLTKVASQYRARAEELAWVEPSIGASLPGLGSGSTWALLFVT